MRVFAFLGIFGFCVVRRKKIGQIFIDRLLLSISEQIVTAFCGV